MNIKDYLHLYIGCEVDTNVQGQYIHPYGCIKIEELTVENLFIILERMRFNEEYYCKPILLPLSDMTEEESREHDQIEMVKVKTLDGTIVHDANAVVWLLSKHFDLFGLIDAGLAIDKTTLNQPA
jgi:hypothetical protein